MGDAQSTLSEIRKHEREGWQLIGDGITGWRFVQAPPVPRPFHGDPESIGELVEEGLLKEFATGCYRTTDKAKEFLDG